VILVYAPLEVQIERLMKRDGLSREECEKRIRAQMPIEEKKKLADYIIDNSSDISKTKRQVEEVYEKIYR
jgi:dephospho-CoA kinase